MCPGPKAWVPTLSNASFFDIYSHCPTLAEAAAAKIYITEAEKYDKALAVTDVFDEQSIGDLFSASLAAFLIESYKTLKPDWGDVTVGLLSQISLQLAASATFTVPPHLSIRPNCIRIDVQRAMVHQSGAQPLLRHHCYGSGTMGA
ncbi:hypothetical protein B0H13DRAFT_1873726 [Mycena leptocephala]|nr:hypothetical protein B0H13DRAFT_1873726 [Mycena leptocephala]